MNSLTLVLFVGKCDCIQLWFSVLICECCGFLSQDNYGSNFALKYLAIPTFTLLSSLAYMPSSALRCCSFQVVCPYNCNQSFVPFFVVVVLSFSLVVSLALSVVVPPVLCP